MRTGLWSASLFFVKLNDTAEEDASVVADAPSSFFHQTVLLVRYIRDGLFLFPKSVCNFVLIPFVFWLCLALRIRVANADGT